MLIIVLLLLLLLVLVLLVYYNNKSDIVSNNIYLSSNESYKLLIDKSDNFFNRFNKYDFKARNIKSIKDYELIISKCVSNFSLKQKEIINKITREIDLIDLSCDWIDNDKLRKIPWKLSLIKSNRLYENSYPHTRLDTIIIPQNQIRLTEQFKNTLLHEKLHVYQKLYPDDFQIYLDNNNYIKLFQYNDSNNKYKCRANPDTDDWIYIKNNNIYKSEYNTNIKSINNVIYTPVNDSRYEHPREKAVYDLLEKIL